MNTFHKSYVYLTHENHLLVFNEPETRTIGYQLPGGTLDPGESHLQAARREFTEETGFKLEGGLHPLMDVDFIYEDGAAPALHKRRFYHARLLQDKTADWHAEQTFDHYELTPSAGGPPILFRFSWLDLNKLVESKPQFYAGFDAPLPRLLEQLQL